MCMQEFFTRERLISHIEDGSFRCRAALETAFEQIPQEVFDELEERSKQEVKKLQDLGRSRTFAEVSAVRVDGPLPLVAELYAIDHRLGLKKAPCS